MKHLACIMDGNRRWGRKHLLNPLEGHKKGIEAAEMTIDFCLKKSIPHLSLYTLSVENLKRSAIELDFLFLLSENKARDFLQETDKKGVRFRFVGDRSLFPKKLVPFIEAVEQKSIDGTRLQVNLLFCYGAQQEMLEGFKSLLHQQKNSPKDIDTLSIDDIYQSLWSSHAPPPDLIVRTGNVKRLSNFLLFQAAYSELYFLDCLWPDITQKHLEDAVQFFEQSQRNFGK